MQHQYCSNLSRVHIPPASEVYRKVPKFQLDDFNPNAIQQRRSLRFPQSEIRFSPTILAATSQNLLQDILIIYAK